MNRLMGFVILLFTFSVLSGCSGVIHKTFSVDGKPASSLSVDARQRVILVTDSGGRDGRHVVCAEPSPDAVSATAASFAGEFGFREVSAKAKAALAESIARLGPRTNTIQLLRDALYRACEAYMNGILDKKEYHRILLGYDETMITLLAIDGLTQPAQVIPGEILTKAKTEESGGETSTEAAGESGATQPKTASATASVGVSKEVAETVQKILEKYYEFQLRIKGIRKD